MSRSKLTIKRAAPPEVDETLIEDEAPKAPVIPSHWQKGQLLNVRNVGYGYVITAYPEEDDPRYPERTLTFTNPGECQDFVSRWYARENHDPRA